MTQDHVPSLNLASLPDEILQTILQYLDATSLVRLGVTARRFVAPADEPLLWKQKCQDDFRYWNDRRAFREQLRDVSYQEWKSRYIARRLISRSVRQTLDEVVDECRGRSDRIQAIVDSGYEAKEALMKAFKESPQSPNHLALKYWSHIALGCLHRSVALEQWTRIKYRTDVDNPTERALAAFDMFILDEEDVGDVDDIFDRLDSYVAAVRTSHPDLDEQTPRTKAIIISSYLRERRWVGLDPNRPFRTLDSVFLGRALFSSHKNSLPLITSIIYSYVARQFGLRAQPINFPIHVRAVVQPPRGLDLDGNPLSSNVDPDVINEKTHLYMDPYHQTEPVPIETLHANLRFIDSGFLLEQATSFMTPASHRDLLIRCANNILSSQSMDAGSLHDHRIATDSATYAAYFALTLFPTQPATLRTQLTQLTQHLLHFFEHDMHVFRTYILPLTNNLPDHVAYRNLANQLTLSDNEAPVPRLRTAAHTAATITQHPSLADPDLNLASLSVSAAPRLHARVAFRVGQLFRHKRRGYRAVIYGWDPACKMTSQWITMNQVDRLSRGRAQPFYHVLVLDDRSTRYVAEENVALLGPAEEGGNGDVVTARQVETWPIEIGKWMRRFDVKRTARGPDGAEVAEGWGFVSNVREEYPED